MNIAITGEGIISAIGHDKATVLESLREGRSGIGEMRYLPSTHHELPVGEVKWSDEELQSRLSLDPSGKFSRTAMMGMWSIRQALEDSLLLRKQEKCPSQEYSTDSCLLSPDSSRIVLISGTTVAGMDLSERYFAEMVTDGGHLECLLDHSCGDNTRLMAEHFGCFTDYTTISTACSSAANALILGANMLKAGEADIVVAGGTEALSLFHLNGFNSLMILDKERCRPFDDTRAGLNLGEGAAFVVMETEEHARQRQAPIHAYLSGYGNACDAFHQTASSDNGEGAYLAMREALEMAGLQPSDIDYVNAHGTGTPNNDQSESVALQRVFGSDLPPVSSTKGFTGHTTSASGSIEAVICLLAMHHGFIPANLGFAHPMSDGIVPSIGAEGCQLRHVLCNSFGFGGNDSAIVLSRNEEGGTRNEISLRQDQRQKYSPSSFLLPPSSKIKELSRVEITSIDQLSEIRDYVKPLEARRMGKVMLSPTNFMQSTHNTISSNIAIRLGCHGYNVTYTQSDDSLEWALRDARLLLQSGRYKTVLVGCHDETTPLYRSLMERLGIHDLPDIHSIAIVLKGEKVKE